jgi:hypothetical protein
MFSSCAATANLAQAQINPRDARLPVFRLFLWLLLLTSMSVVPAGAGRAVDIAELRAIGRELLSHRAFYTLSVSRMDPRNYRHGISGGLKLDFVNACDGYALNQRFLIETTTDDGPILNDMMLNSWESQDGQRFRFRLKDEVNGDLDQELDGEATVSEPGGEGIVRFTLPPDTELALPRNVVFPTEHTIRLLAMARAGTNWLQLPVYDGSSADSYADIGAFISAELPVETGEKEVLAPLKGQRSWRVRLAYFTSEKMQDTPDYEIGYRLYESGIVDDVVFDYGDYAIRATLRQLDVKPRDAC